VSPIRYAFEGILTNEFEDLSLISPVKLIYGFDWGISLCLWGLFGCCILFRVMAFISLKLQAKTLGW